MGSFVGSSKHCLIAIGFSALLAGCLPVPVRTEPIPEPPPESVTASTRESAAPLAPEAALAAKALIVPVEGVAPSRVRDSYTAARGGRTHDAVDIMAPRGTPVIAADAGTILRLRENEAGGITIYQLDPDERFVYFSRTGPGPVIEVGEGLPPKAAMYRAIADAARTRDGTEPVREASLAGR